MPRAHDILQMLIKQECIGEINSNEETDLPTGSALFDSITQCHIGAAVVFM